MIKILLVEDDVSSAYMTQGGLELTGLYQVVWAKDGEEGWQFFQTEKPDIVVTDVEMPRMDGYELVRKIRKVDSSVIVIMESGKTMPKDIKEGYNVGVDDYIKKPFVAEELHLHIQAILKRSSGKTISHNPPLETSDQSVIIGRYVFDTDKESLSLNGQVTQKLTSREAQLLLLLYENRNRTVLRSEILQRFWAGDDTVFTSRSLDVFISKLRNYLSNDSSLKIVNERKKGLMLETT